MLQVVLPRVQTSEWGEWKRKLRMYPQSGVSAKRSLLSPIEYFPNGIYMSPKNWVWTNATWQNNLPPVEGTEADGFVPYHYRFILSHSSRQQLGFKPCSLSPVTYSRQRGREQDFRFLWGSAETREREGRAGGPEGRGRQAGPPLPTTDPFPGVPPGTTLLAGPVELRRAPESAVPKRRGGGYVAGARGF